MKPLLLAFFALLLSGCFRQSSLVTVGATRVRDGAAIVDYSFYAHELVAYFDSLPKERRHGVRTVKEVSENQLRFAFDGLSKQESDSAIAVIFDSFGYSRYQARFNEWEKNKREMLRPVADLSRTDPEKFKEIALSMVYSSSAPVVEVYILRIE